MNIKGQTEYILNHPGFDYALSKYKDGESSLMFDLLYNVQLHCIDVQIKASHKEYGSCKRMNTMDIKERLIAMKQPDNLNVFIPIPPIQQECKVVNLISHIKRKVARYFNPLQLSLFQDYSLKQVSL